MPKDGECSIARRCPYCGAGIPDGAVRCPQCGNRVPDEGYPLLHADGPSERDMREMKALYAPPDILFRNGDRRRG